MARRSVSVAAISAAGLAGAALLAFLPYTAEEFRGSPLTVHCGSPVLAWRNDAEVTGRDASIGTGGAAVERYPVCGKGVAERLVLVVGVLAVAQVAAGVTALTGWREH